MRNIIIDDVSNAIYRKFQEYRHHFYCYSDYVNMLTTIIINASTYTVGVT